MSMRGVTPPADIVPCWIHTTDPVKCEVPVPLPTERMSSQSCLQFSSSQE